MCRIYIDMLDIDKTDQMPCPLELIFQLNGDRQLTKVFACLMQARGVLGRTVQTCNCSKALRSFAGKKQLSVSALRPCYH